MDHYPRLGGEHDLLIHYWGISTKNTCFLWQIGQHSSKTKLIRAKLVETR